MISARGLPLAATSLIPVLVSLKSSAVKCASPSARLAAQAAACPSSKKLKANSNATRPARRRRMARFPALTLREGDTPPSRTVTVTASLRGAAAALLGHGIEVAALELHPVADQILGGRDVRRPSRTRHELLRLPHHVELAVRPDLADEHRLGDVMVRQQRGHAARQVRRLGAGKRL